MLTNTETYMPYNDYAQSANTLFHFMKEIEYLKNILLNRAIVPRYCIETVDYLNIYSNGHKFDEIAILQKCFCDIPFHKLADSFSVNGVGEAFESLNDEDKVKLENNNTHFDYYGNYAIAFSKNWGERKGLQPIHYLNNESQYTKDFSTLFEKAFADEDLPDIYSDDIINRLSYIKPLRGIMKRRVKASGNVEIDVNIYKNFHDEREWRYVPNSDQLQKLKIESIIANPHELKLINEINQRIQEISYESMWLDFAYDDIKYIIVPDIYARTEIINTIMRIEDEYFNEKENIPMQKYVLISKVLVLEEIRRDW